MPSIPVMIALAAVFSAAPGAEPAERSPSSQPSPGLSLSREQAVAAAGGASILSAVAGVARTDLAANARFDPETILWTVTYGHAGAPVARVTVADADGRVVRGVCVEPDGTVMAVNDVLAAADGVTAYRRFREWYPDGVAEVTFGAGSRRWRIHMRSAGRTVGDIYLEGGRAAAQWVREPRPGRSAEVLLSMWRLARPYFYGRGWEVLSSPGWVYVYAALLILLFINARRLGSLRTLDLLMISLAVPVGFWLRTPFIMLIGYGLLFVMSLYLFLRCVGRAARRPVAPEPDRAPFAGHFPTWVLIVVAMVAVVHQCTIGGIWDILEGRPPDPEHVEGTGGPGHGGLVGGERFFETGVMPYGTLGRGFDIYGPFHYVLHGAAAQAWPSGVDWRTYDAEENYRVADDTGARVVCLLFHLLTAAALVGIGRKHFGSGRLGWLFAVGYLLTATNMGYLFHGSRRIPAALVVMALWAFPNPILSGVLLALGGAALWYPLFLFPLWLSAFRGRKAVAFLVSFAAVGVVFVGLTLRGDQPVLERARLVLDRTAGFEEGVGRGAWGRTPDKTGFWGQLELRDPLFGVGRVAITVAYLWFCVVLYVWPREKTPLRLAALTAAVIIGTQLWKSTRTGEYIGWYAPVLMVALFAPAAGRGAPTASAVKASSTTTPKPGETGQ